MLIVPISNNNNSFCGKKQIISILSSTELRKLSEYKHKFDYSENKPISAGIKRTMDVILSAVGIIATAPIMIAGSIAIKIDSKGSFLFKQERIGKDGKLFTIYKLRSMQTTAGEDLLQNQSDKRVTRVGKFLRKYSIDELPQLFNVIKGDMTLVGPRPINKKSHNLRKNDKDFFLRYSVKPGTTLDYPDIKVDNIPNLRINTEKEYIENWSLKKDLKILTHIISKIFEGKNY